MRNYFAQQVFQQRQKPQKIIGRGFTRMTRIKTNLPVYLFNQIRVIRVKSAAKSGFLHNFRPRRDSDLMRVSMLKAIRPSLPFVQKPLLQELRAPLPQV